MLAADLAFALERPGQEPVRGSVRGEGNRLQVELDDPSALAGAGDAPTLRVLAEALAARDVVLRVVHRGDHLVSLGAVSAPWWQRRFTGTRRIRLGSLRGVWTSARGRLRSTAAVLPDAGLTPASTLWPIAPTMVRRPRRQPTTTHDPAHGGSPRLVMTKQAVALGERSPVFWLHDGLSLGSDPSNDVCLPGLAPRHARIVHDDADEWLVVAVEGVTRVHGAPVVRQILRTGARVEIGPYALAYTREEYADHGRPFGGRIGGELGHQIPQPPRDRQA